MTLGTTLRVFVYPRNLETDQRSPTVPLPQRPSLPSGVSLSVDLGHSDGSAFCGEQHTKDSLRCQFRPHRVALHPVQLYFDYRAELDGPFIPASGYSAMDSRSFLKRLCPCNKVRIISNG